MKELWIRKEGARTEVMAGDAVAMVECIVWSGWSRLGGKARIEISKMKRIMEVN